MTSIELILKKITGRKKPQKDLNQTKKNHIEGIEGY